MLVRGERHQTKTGRFGSVSRFSFRLEPSDMQSFAIDMDRSCPLPLPSVPVNAAISRRAALQSWNVLHVASMRYDAQISSTIVETAAVDMVNLGPVPPRREPHKESVHQDGNLPGAFMDRSVGVSETVKSPYVGGDQISVSGVNEGVRSNAAISGAERDEDGILRLHRTLQRSGARPLPVSSRSGLCCVNYTRSASMTARTRDQR